VGPEVIKNTCEKTACTRMMDMVLLSYILAYRYTGSVQKVK